jgi:hypothetical protein
VALTGQTEVTLAKHGIVAPVTSVIKATTNEAVGAINFVVDQTSPSSGTTDGDEVTTMSRIEYPTAPSLASTTGDIPAGQYRYGVTWVHPDGESGIDPANVASITLVSTGGVDLTSIDITGAPSGTTGRNIYRSKNLGTTGNPSWGPWQRITSGTTIADMTTVIFTDDEDDLSANPEAPVGIASGETLYVQYDFADETYYMPTFFDTLDDVIQKYGPIYTDTGAIDSELSFGASRAFLNGASSIVCLAVTSPAGASEFESAIQKLVDEEDITMIVPLHGSASVHSALASHITQMNNAKKYRVGIIGYDGSDTIVPADTIRSAGDTYGATEAGKALQLINQSFVNFYNGFINREIPIGAFYVGAALAGMYAARSPQETLTRKQISGFSSLGEIRSENAKNTDASHGLLVVEMKGEVMRVRHSISTDVSDINTREFSVTLAKHDMIKTVLELVDNAIIGQMNADELAPVMIQSFVAGILQSKVEQRRISGYTGLRVVPATGDPTTMDISWQWKPMYAVNYLSITIGLNLNTGVVGLGGVTGSTGLIL